MAITTIIFDLGGVLVWTHWEKLTQPLAHLSGQTSEQVMDRIRLGNAYYPFMRGELNRAEFHDRIAQEFRLDLDPDTFFEMWASIIEPNHDINPLIEQLEERYRLSIGSNTDEIHWQRGLEVQSIHEHFADPLLSFEIGHCKPDADFFNKGLQRLSVEGTDIRKVQMISESLGYAVGSNGIIFAYEAAEK